MDFSKPKRIFLVDDDVMQTEVMRDYLTSGAAHIVSVFNSGEDCLKRLSENPDIVILDYHLNSINKDAANGMAILETIRKFYPQIHVIMLSSQERYGVAMQSLQKGAEHYVIKDENSFGKIKGIIESIK